MAGNFGQYLLIDLSSNTSGVFPLSDSTSMEYVGGVGLAVHLMLAHNGHESEPLESESPIVFSFSPLVGSPLTTTAKFAVVHRSPLTGLLNDSLVGSRFAIAGKCNGVDAIVVLGKSPAWSILKIDDGEMSLLPADGILGNSADETENLLKSKLGPGFQVASIGLAGENLVSFATITHDGRHAGRGGAGAVLGSKNIKAIAVRGTRRIEWAHTDRLVKYARNLSKRSLGPETFKYRALGTVSNLEVFNKLEMLPTNNFQQNKIENVEHLNLKLADKTKTRIRSGCVACTIGCEHRFEITNTGEANTENSSGIRAEYESLFALGPLCGISDRDTVLQAMQKCDRLGMDSISAGGSIAFLMECREKGLVSFGPRFGEADQFLTAIELIATRADYGELLSQGSRKMAKEIGHNSIDFAPQIKGLELPGYDPAKLQTLALGMAVNSRGADHNRSSAYEVDFSESVDRLQITRNQVRQAIETENRAAILDSLILCKFLRKIFDDLFESAGQMLNMVTGHHYTSQDIHQVACRIIDAKKVFNIKCGWTRELDTVPKRFLSSSGTVGSAKINENKFREMVVEYYRQRGWNDYGIPTSERIEELEKPTL